MLLTTKSSTTSKYSLDLSYFRGMGFVNIINFNKNIDNKIINNGLIKLNKLI